MDKKKLIPFLLLSLLIHVVVLTGINVLAPPTPAMPELPKLIPVEVVFIEQKPSSILTFRETELVTDGLLAKAQTTMGTPTAATLEELPGPIPEKGTFRPSMNVERIPTPSTLSVGEEGEEVESRRIVSRAPTPRLRLPAVPQPPSDQLPLLDVEEARVLTQAKKGAIPKKKKVKEAKPKIDDEQKRVAAIKEIQRKVAERKTEEAPVTASRMEFYFGMVRERVKRFWVIPDTLVEEEGLEAVIVIQIDKDGLVIGSRFERSSGNPYFDQSAMRAIAKAAPFPPPPLRRTPLEIGLVFQPH